VSPAARDDPVVERLTDGLVRLSEAEQFRRVADAGVPMAPTIAAGSEEAAVRAADQLGYPVVVKGSVSGVLHKSDHGLIALDLRSPEAVRVAAQRLLAVIAGRGGELLVQHQVERGVELIVGARQVPGFGTLVAVGPGGTLAEVMHEVSVRLGPVDEATALAMLHETAAGKLLAGLRGGPPADITSATRAIARISQVAHDAGRSIGTVEVNPLIVLAAGRGSVGVDLVLEPIAPIGMTGQSNSASAR
jgi:succinyl-CoA synthetase beta subunit